MALACAAAPPARAQAPAEKQEAGFLLGSLRVSPALGAGAGWESNLFEEATGATASPTLRLAPDLDIRTGWSRHGLRLTAGAEAGMFTASRADDYIDYGVELAGVLDITRDHRLRASLAWTRGHERRGTDDGQTTLAATGPTIDHDLLLTVTGEAGFGRFRLSPFLEARNRDYRDVALTAGGVLNNDDRDRRTLIAGAEIAYEVRRGYRAFLRPAFVLVDYADPVDDGGLDRDSSGFRVTGGVEVDLTRLLEASFGIGYLARDYSAPGLARETGLALDIGGTWHLSPRTRLDFAALRRIEETTLPGSTGSTVTELRLGLTHGLRHTLDLRLDAGGELADFTGTTRTDRTVAAGLALDWRMTRRLTLTPGYRFTARRSTAPGFGYTDHLLRLDARFAF